MSLTAVLVMAAVVLVLLGAWLIAVFRAARQPASGHAHPDGQGVAEQQIDPRGAGADFAGHPDTPPGQADQAAAQTGKAGSPPARTARGA
jgi:cytoskeletal protein RodZ